MTTNLDELGSSFIEETKELIIFDSKEIIYNDIKVSESHGLILKLRKAQYERFAKFMSDGTASFYDPLGKNNLSRFSKKHATDISMRKSKNF